MDINKDMNCPQNIQHGTRTTIVEKNLFCWNCYLFEPRKLFISKGIDSLSIGKSLVIPYENLFSSALFQPC